MKIAYVHDAVYPFIKGGAEKRMYELSRRLVQRNHEVHIFAMQWWGERKVIEQDGVLIHGVCKSRPLYSRGRRSIRSAIMFASGVVKELLKEKFDIVDCYQAPYLHILSTKMLSTFNKFPLVVTWHEVWKSYWKKYLGKLGIIGEVLEQIILLKLADTIIAVSDQTKEDLITLGVDSTKVYVVPNGIDLKLFARVKPSKEKLDVIYLGRLIKPKNVDLLIKAVSILKRDLNIRVGIIGDGPEKIRLMKLARQLKVEKNMKFFGFIEEYEKIISIMKSSKVFVIPSTQEGGASIVTQEAYACGLPVIAVDHPLGIDKRLIVDGRTGFRVKINPEAIASKIKLLLLNDRLRRSFSKQAIRFVKKFDWEKIVKQIEKIYTDITTQYG
jgi:glycosyltransferase involved in cell wall biosynthesis